MTAATLAAIWRHPIKAHGRERLETVTLAAGEAMPWDRRWAVAHDAARLPEAVGWAPCANFSIGSKNTALTAITARLDETRAEVTLDHPDRPSLTIRPDDPADATRLIGWLRPISPADRAQPERLVALPARGFTDTDYASVSMLNLSSHKSLEAEMGIALSPLRWRCNLWLDGLQPWAEEGWAGRRFRLGEAEIEIAEPIVRCKATTADPATGRVDADTLGALRAARGAQTMGVYARVVAPGRIAVGDILVAA